MDTFAPQGMQQTYPGFSKLNSQEFSFNIKIKFKLKRILAKYDKELCSRDSSVSQ
jgi:hypothetical protein